MITTEADENFIKDIALKSGVAEMNVLAVFEAFLITTYLKLKEKENIYIPFFAEFNVSNGGDEVSESKREAKVKFSYRVHPQLARLVGQVADEEETGFIKNDAVDLLMAITKSALRTKLESFD